MLKVTFKDVGHGDSIILEWIDQEVNKIAFIDCNISDDKRIPSIEYLKSKSEVKEIEFILLSHPHYDHYSGMNNLLKYCENEGIIIKLFMHTAFVNPKYFIKTAVKSLIARDALKELFKTIDLLSKINIIKSQGYVTSDFRELSLTDELKLKIIAPTTHEFERYKNNVELPDDEESCHNAPNANLLSTLIKIYTNHKYLLLTSDCSKSVFNYFNKGKNEGSKAAKIFLGQAPHHGSIKNHNKKFWESLNRNSRSSVVFSCGPNSYKHPAFEVVDFFSSNNYKIKYTNRIGGLISESRIMDNISIELDLSSVKVENRENEYSERKDVEFEFTLSE